MHELKVLSILLVKQNSKGGIHYINKPKKVEATIQKLFSYLVRSYIKRENQQILKV